MPAPLSPTDAALLERLQIAQDFTPQCVVRLAQLIDELQRRVDELERQSQRKRT